MSQIPMPTSEEIATYRDTFRRELDKRMDTRHPSASPSTEAHEIALRQFIQNRNAKLVKPARVEHDMPLSGYELTMAITTMVHACVRVAPVKAVVMHPDDFADMRDFAGRPFQPGATVHGIPIQLDSTIEQGKVYTVR